MPQELGPKLGSTPTDGLKDEIRCALDRIGRELERLEILVAAMAAFNRPIPDYDHGFQHQRHLTAGVTVLRSPPL